jgi:hypothetical protein
MTIDRDDGAERQARLDWMIDEFRKAQSRRFAKANDKAVDSHVESDSKAAVSGETTKQ